MMDMEEPPLQKGEVVIFSDGKTGTVSRAYPLEDKYAIKALGALTEIRGPEGSFFYFKLTELRRAMPLQPADVVEPPMKQPRFEGAVGAGPHVAASMQAPGLEAVKQALDGMFTGEKRLEGRVKWFSKEKGFGKIIPKGSTQGDELFVHKNQMEGGPDGPHAQAIAEGALVTYEVTQVDDKPCACAVQVKGINRALARVDLMPLQGNREELIRKLLLSGLQVGNFAMRGGGKANMEDRVLASPAVTVDRLGNTCKKAVCAFFGVFDGHSGGTCSEFVSSNLDRNVFDCLRQQSKRDVTSDMAVRSGLLAAFRTTEHNYFQYINKLEGAAASSWATAGSTACTACFFGPDEHGRLRLAIANAGDSRAVLGKKNGKSVRLSQDHQPDVPSERKRIEAAGGQVVQCSSIWRIVLPSKKGLGMAGLSVSRGFGDLEYKQPAAIVSAVPDISMYTLDLREDSFIVIGSDGIWNSCQDAEAVRMVTSGLRDAAEVNSSACKHAAQQLVEEAHRRDSSDDKTALVLWFGDLPDSGSGAIPVSGGTLAPRSQHKMIAPTHIATPTQSGDDMFAVGDAKAAKVAPPKPDVSEPDLDDLFAAYAREMGQKQAK